MSFNHRNLIFSVWYLIQMPSFGKFQKEENYPFFTQWKIKLWYLWLYTYYDPFLWESLKVHKNTWNKNVHKYEVKAG